jgi:hypothetical protein
LFVFFPILSIHILCNTFSLLILAENFGKFLLEVRQTTGNLSEIITDGHSSVVLEEIERCRYDQKSQVAHPSLGYEPFLFLFVIWLVHSCFIRK